MSKHKSCDLEPCPVCGKDAQWKDVMQPFYHGWVGCKTCQRFIRWTGRGKRSAVDQWNREASKSNGKSQKLPELRRSI